MNVIYLNGEKTWGTPAQYALDLAEAMLHLGHRVSIATSAGRRSEQRFASTLGCENVIHLNSLPVLGMLRLSGILKKSGPVIVHTGSLNDASFAVRAKEMSGNAEAHVVVTLHDPHFDEVEPTAQSPLQREIFGKCEAVLHPLPYSTPHPENCADLSGDKTFVFHGRITPDKHIDRLLEAMAKVSDLDFRLRIIGEGSARDVMPLKQSTRRLGIADRVDWMGYREDARSLLSGCTAGVYPDRRSSAYAISECIAQGIPVITGHDAPLDESLRAMLTEPQYAEELRRKNLDLCPADFADFIRGITSLYSGLL